MEELIPNHALNKAAEWFNRQKISKMESESIVVDKPTNKDDDISEVARQLLCDATEEANKKKRHDKNVGGGDEGKDKQVLVEKDPKTPAEAKTDQAITT